mgnify:CR=1 FL=1
MNPGRRLQALMLMALVVIVGIVGIVGMLVMEGLPDLLFFVLAMLPLVLGGWRWMIAGRARQIS